MKSAKAKLRYRSWRELTSRERKALQREAMAGHKVPAKVPKKYRPVPKHEQVRRTAGLHREAQARADDKLYQKYRREGFKEEFKMQGRNRRRAARTARAHQIQTKRALKTAPRGPISTMATPGKEPNLLMKMLRNPKAAVAEAGGFSGLASKAGKGALKAAPAVGLGLMALNLLSYGKAQYDASQELARLKGTPETDAEAYLKGFRKQQIMMARQGRLMRNDPEAYRALKDYAGGVSAPTPLATGEFVVGGAPQGQPGTSEEVRALLASL